MSEFSFRDLIPPGEGGRAALQRELEERRKRWDKPGYRYRGAGDLLLQHGETFTGRDLPEEYVHLMGPPSRCFDTALAAALATPGLRLFEGVYSTGGGHFTPHGWCVAPDGGVLELTYPTRDRAGYLPGDLAGIPGAKVLDPEHWVYCGVEIQPELVRWCLDEGSIEVPLMDRPAADQRYAHALDVEDYGDHPFLKVPYDPARTRIP